VTSVAAATIDHGADERFMGRALELATLGRFWASPNPHVGCVLVRDGVEIGAGFTQPAGGNHAEIEALQSAGDVRGATAYVTLEPCAHQGRTGPCAQALIDAGITRVVAAIEDPNPEVAGRGLKMLAGAGLDVRVGVLAAAAEAEIQGFLLRMRRGWGRVRLKLACSLDGRTAMASGESQWITGPEARSDVQRLRAESSVVLTGSGTVLSDDCSLTVRAEQLDLGEEARHRAIHRAPLRVVLDSRGRVPASARVLQGAAPSLVLLGPDVPAQPGVASQVIPLAPGGGLDLTAALTHLGGLGANEILVEAGPTLAAGFLAAGWVDELVLYQAPVLLGASARPLTALQLDRLADGVGFSYVDVSGIGDDLRIVARPE